MCRNIATNRKFLRVNTVCFALIKSNIILNLHLSLKIHIMSLIPSITVNGMCFDK
jgi:hypothetical protein